MVVASTRSRKSGFAPVGMIEGKHKRAGHCARRVSTGSILAILKVGRKAAKSATRTSNTETTQRVSGSYTATPKSWLRSSLTATEDNSNPPAKPATVDVMPVRATCNIAPRMRAAKSHANAKLPPPLSHQIGDEPVDSNGRKHERQRGERRQQTHFHVLQLAMHLKVHRSWRKSRRWASWGLLALKPAAFAG